MRPYLVHKHYPQRVSVLLQTFQVVSYKFVPAQFHLHKTMAGLQREIIKWMQGLDLSYSVKNVRKDFANGFLVAEMLSRYHSQEINMHSFDNGVGTKTKLDNWEQLMKFFKKKNVNITHEMIKNLIDNKPNAALPIIEIVYTFLTERKYVDIPIT